MKLYGNIRLYKFVILNLSKNIIKKIIILNIGVKISKQKKKNLPSSLYGWYETICKWKEKMDKLISPLKSFSRDIYMKFGLDKCTTLYTKKDTIWNPNEHILPKLNVYTYYKYLHHLESSKFHNKESKNGYYRRVRQIIKA